MKQFLSLLFFSLFVSLYSCKKEDPTPPCQLTGIDRGNGNKHTYVYNASGKITQMLRDFDGSGSGKIQKYVYTFTYDAAGLLTKSTWTLDGKADGEESYTYSGGKVSKATFTYADGTKGVNNLKHNATGLITEFSIEFGDPNTDYKQVFEYNANSILTKRSFTDLSGKEVFFSIGIKPAGASGKSPEQLLVSGGLPYDVLTGTPWQVLEGGVGTQFESFEMDENGKLVLLGTDKTTVSNLDSNGYVVEQTIVDSNNQTFSAKYSITGCN